MDPVNRWGVIRFDWDAAVEAPGRIRSGMGAKPVEIRWAGDWLILRWAQHDNRLSAYTKDQATSYLGLTPNWRGLDV